MGIENLENRPAKHEGPVEGTIAPPPHWEGDIEVSFEDRGPQNSHDLCYAYITNYEDREERVGPCGWMPRVIEGTCTNAAGTCNGGDIHREAHVLLPSIGDPCAVMFTDSDTPIIIMWWPSEWPTRFDWPGGWIGDDD